MNLLSSLLTYTARQIAALRSKDTSQDTEISGAKGRLTTAESNISTLTSRIETAISAVTTDTEVTDIRVGDDGVTYGTAGTAVRTQFSQLKSGFNYQTDSAPISFTDGYNITLAFNTGTTVDLTPSAVASYRYAIVNCAEGDIFLLNCKGGQNPRAYGFVDANNVLLQVANQNYTASNLVLIAPYGASKLVINDNLKTGVCYKGCLSKTVDNTKAVMDNTREYLPISLFDKSHSGQIDVGTTIGATVSLIAGTNASYEHIIVPCKEKDQFLIRGRGGGSPRLWAFLDSSNKLLSESANNADVNSGVITAPKNADKLIMNNHTGYYSDPMCANITNEQNVYQLDNRLDNIGVMASPRNRLFSAPDVDVSAFVRGIILSDEIASPLIDFKKSGDLMVHVPTFTIVDDVVYCTYYANTRHATETPSEHTARLAYCSLNDPSDMVWLDLQDVGDTFDGKTVNAIYDTILMRIDEETIYCMWTAMLDSTYCRLYCTLDIDTKTLSAIDYNNFYVGETGGEWTTTNMISAFATEGIETKTISSDIGIMQKITSRVENGTTWYYTGCYANAFNCIIKSSDLITWYFVAQPDFDFNSKFENACYLENNKVYYFVRQADSENSGVLTAYNLNSDTWDVPVAIGDAQSRSDFFKFGNYLYLVHAPIDRYHIGLTRIYMSQINRSVPYAVAEVDNSFYPYTLAYNGEMYMAYTQNRQHIYLCKFTMPSITNAGVINLFKTALGL